MDRRVSTRARARASLLNKDLWKGMIRYCDGRHHLRHHLRMLVTAPGEVQRRMDSVYYQFAQMFALARLSSLTLRPHFVCFRLLVEIKLIT